MQIDSLIYANDQGEEGVDANQSALTVHLPEVGSLEKRGLSRGKYNRSTSHSKRRFEDDYPTRRRIQRVVPTIIHLSDKSHQS